MVCKASRSIVSFTFYGWWFGFWPLHTTPSSEGLVRTVAGWSEASVLHPNWNVGLSGSLHHLQSNDITTLSAMPWYASEKPNYDNKKGWSVVIITLLPRTKAYVCSSECSLEYRLRGSHDRSPLRSWFPSRFLRPGCLPSGSRPHSVRRRKDENKEGTETDWGLDRVRSHIDPRKMLLIAQTEASIVKFSFLPAFDASITVLRGMIVK